MSRPRYLTWLANMIEHVVLSAGSAVMLRISCSMGVMPAGTHPENHIHW